MFFPVILAGGSGTRLWPLSRQLYPKQFLPLLSQKTMFQMTLERLEGIKHNNPIVVCSKEHRFLVAEQLRQIGIDDAAILLEPVGKNTAPAIALAALYAIDKAPDAVLLVMPSDHYIATPELFHKALDKALKAANTGQLVTFGVVPVKPETGYGYIKRGPNIDDEVFKVERFVEKPDKKTAEMYLEEGTYYWNSGMFVFKAKTYLNELKKLEPGIYDCCQKAFQGAKQDLDFLRIDEAAFIRCPANSIDYAVMEKTQNAAVVPMDAGWSDIGSWTALWETCPKDKEENCLKGDIISKDTHRCFIRSEGRLIATIGIKDLIIIDTKDALLVADKNKTQDVKEIVETLKQQKREEPINHREVYRPWGFYDSIEKRERYQVKRITVKPGGKLSLQLHHHRAEHWIVVRGTAKVTLEDKTFLVSENESTFIPVGKVHSLENPGKIPLELIEVQSGSYLGEDDIVRLEDLYGRSGEK